MEPHEHTYFEKYGWTDNHCRGIDHNALWCYTTDKDKRWEECDCTKKGKTTNKLNVMLQINLSEVKRILILKKV